MKRARFPLCVAVLALLAAGSDHVASPARADQPPPDKVFILAGDGNMVGRGQPLGDGLPSDPRLFVLRDGAWTVAADPLGDPTDSRNGIGVGMSFGLDALDDLPGATVGLVMCAAHVTTMASWQSGQRISGCISTARAAGGQIAGLLFLEGEADARQRKLAKAWGTRFRAMLSTFRAKLGVDLPYVVGQLGNLQEPAHPWASLVRDEQAASTAGQPGVSLVSTLDLSLADDGASFTPAGYTTVGSRLEDAWFAASATWHAPDELVVLAGQSNMVGRGKPISAGTSNTSPTLLVRRGDTWQIATDPLAPPKTRERGVGPGMTFGLDAVQYEADKTVGLLMCAVNGASITDWLPGADAYEDCVSAVEEAGAPLRGILFLQGESEAQSLGRASAWRATFEQVLSGFRTDLGADTPFVLGQIGTIEGHREYRFAPVVRDQQAEAAAAHPEIGFVVTSDLPLANDIHFSVESYKTVGHRFATAWWELAGS